MRMALRCSSSSSSGVRDDITRPFALAGHVLLALCTVPGFTVNRSLFFALLLLLLLLLLERRFGKQLLSQLCNGALDSLHCAFATTTTTTTTT